MILETLLKAGAVWTWSGERVHSVYLSVLIRVIRAALTPAQTCALIMEKLDDWLDSPVFCLFW